MINIENLIKGIDISSVQDTLDFNQIVAQGFKFVIAKCGSGNDGIDPLYASNISKASQAGLLTGCYHFIYPLPNNGTALRDPVSQAQYHFNASNGASVVFCDLEWPEEQDWIKWGVSATSIKTWTLAYLQAYTNLNNGIKPIIYTYPYFAQALNLAASPEFANYQLWIASYEPQPASIAPWNGNWVMWQQGQIKLYNGVPCDIDYVQDLSLWNGKSIVSTPNPQPIIETPLNPISVPANTIPEPISTPTPTPVSDLNSGSTVSPQITSIFSIIYSFLVNLFGKK